MIKTIRYVNLPIVMHWLLAVLVLAMIGIGLSMVELDLPAATKFRLFQLHKSIGIVVLLLVPLRLFARAYYRPPALPRSMPGPEQRAALATHIFLYGAMVLMPLGGWAMVSLSPRNIPTVLFGLVVWPHISWLADLESKATWFEPAVFLHRAGGWALAAVVVLHVAAALRHHFFIKDNVLWRMLPFWRARPE